MHPAQRFWRLALVASMLGAVTAGCRGCATEQDRAAPDATTDATSSASPDASSRDTRTDLVRHDCTGVEPAVVDCPDTRGPGDALIHFSERLTEIPADHRPPTATFWDIGRAALAATSDLEITKLAYAERVHVQNAALHLALEAERGKQGDLARAAAATVRKLAFDVAQREASREPRGLDGWLGPPTTWAERTKAGEMFHEVIFLQTRLLRIIRTPVLHANFTQLFAVDVEGRPFLTSVVGSIEIRRGEANTSPACVAIASPERVRCGAAAGLAAVRDFGELPKNHFLVQRVGDRLPCNGCHTAAAESDGMLLGVFAVDAGASSAELARREALLVETLSRSLAKLSR